MSNNFSKIMLGERKTSEYGTPIDFFNKLNSIFHFGLDPCAFSDNRLNLDVYITKEKDGLSFSWPWDTFINPPFGTKKGEQVVDWIRKMKQESDKYPNHKYVMLLPTRIESNWFQEEIFNDDKAIIYVLRGRLKFYNLKTNKNDNPHPMGSVLYIRDRSMDNAHDLMRLLPGVFIKKVIIPQ